MQIQLKLHKVLYNNTLHSEIMKKKRKSHKKSIVTSSSIKLYHSVHPTYLQAIYNNIQSNHTITGYKHINTHACINTHTHTHTHTQSLAQTATAKKFRQIKAAVV